MEEEVGEKKTLNEVFNHGKNLYEKINESLLEARVRFAYLCTFLCVLVLFLFFSSHLGCRVSSARERGVPSVYAMSDLYSQRRSVFQRGRAE
jgi:hypothetical protein